MLPVVTMLLAVLMAPNTLPDKVNVPVEILPASMLPDVLILVNVAPAALTFPTAETLPALACPTVKMLLIASIMILESSANTEPIKSPTNEVAVTLLVETLPAVKLAVVVIV